MTHTMRAAVYHGRRDVRVSDVPRPIPGPGDVLVHIARTGLCGTDATEWAHGPVMVPLNQLHPFSHHVGPMILGHEMVGTIVTAPEGSLLSPGTLVAGGAQVACGDCRNCHEGRINVCARLWTLGLQANGGLAEYVAGPAEYWIPVPAGLSVDAAGLAQPLAVGLHAARRGGVQDGDRVLVIGAGAVGTFTLVGLRALYTNIDVTVSDVTEERLSRARRLGADHTVDARTDRPDARAYDVVIEASGAPGMIGQAVRCARKGGRVLIVGIAAAPQEIDAHEFVPLEITIDSTNGQVTHTDLPLALELLATTALADELFEGVRGLEDVAATLDDLAAGRLGGKILIDPGR